jgi:diguanylate cyclase (GGDEF)-like protein
MDARAEVKSRDEIGELAESFNTMANRVAGSQMDLLKLNAELEERVQQRTQELEELAARDPLTGLYNRRYFGEVIHREFAAADRYDDDLTCLMFDLDYFKVINDNFGHRTGDGILITLADSITRELRGSDVAARFGGDEFILLLPQSSASAASRLADRIVRTFAQEAQKSYPLVNPTLSIGVASLKATRAATAEALIHEADTALYSAKDGGRNRTMEATTAAN